MVETYRILEAGEIITEGDEWWNDEDNIWNKIRFISGDTYDSGGGAFIVRRKVYTAPAVTYEAPVEVRAGTPLGVDPLAGLWE